MWVLYSIGKKSKSFEVLVNQLLLFMNKMLSAGRLWWCHQSSLQEQCRLMVGSRGVLVLGGGAMALLTGLFPVIFAAQAKTRRCVSACRKEGTRDFKKVSF